jgi:hypothetical protein
MQRDIGGGESLQGDDGPLSRRCTTAWMQEIEQRREQLPTTPWMHDYRDVGGR